MSEKVFSLIPSICVKKEWEDTDGQDNGVLFNGLAGRQTGMDGERRFLFNCLRCGIELRYDRRDNSVTGPECPQGEPETTIVNLFDKP